MEVCWISSLSPLFLRVLVDPRVRHIDGLCDQRQIITTEMVRFLPEVTVSVEPNDGDIVAVTLTRLVLPDTGLDQAEADGVNWFAGHLRAPSVLRLLERRRGQLPTPGAKP